MHEGHLRLADAAWRGGAVREVVFVPSGTPPHKPAPRASAAHRLEMLRLALAGRRYCRVDDSEIGLESPRYTHDTIAAAKRFYGGKGVAFLMGQDALRDMGDWRMGYRLLDLCPFIVVLRGPAGNIPAGVRVRVQWVPMRMAPPSSTDIRARARAGLGFGGLVPPPVADYIVAHRLYR